MGTLRSCKNWAGRRINRNSLFSASASVSGLYHIGGGSIDENVDKDSLRDLMQCRCCGSAQCLTKANISDVSLLLAQSNRQTAYARTLRVHRDGFEQSTAH
jgi:hypothetical protein